MKLALPTQQFFSKPNYFICTSLVPDCSTRVFICTEKTFNLEPFLTCRASVKLAPPTQQIFLKLNYFVCTLFLANFSTRILLVPKKYLAIVTNENSRGTIRYKRNSFVTIKFAAWVVPTSRWHKTFKRLQFMYFF